MSSTAPDPAMIGAMLSLAAARQHLYDANPGALKVEAKKRAAQLVATRAKKGAHVLDLGSEIFYLPAFHEIGVRIEPLQLMAGEDMHALQARDAYDGALAMHVLEHSPMPLLVLMLLRRAVKPGGFLYVAVPHPRRKWIKHAAHFTVLHPLGWRRLLADAGWRVIRQESGPFGGRSIEERFLCA